MRLISQPFPDGHDLSQMLDRLSDDDGLTELVVVVAWAKRSGFRQVERALGRLRERGVRITIIVGISEGGATRQGLHRALEVADAAFVYHVAGRTFHPKLYVGSGPESFTALVGSHNLTRGGAVENFELGVVVEVSLRRTRSQPAKVIAAAAILLVAGSVGVERLNAALDP